MRTTLDIDDDILAAAKEIAVARRRTAGQVISDLARQALTRALSEKPPSYRNGFPVLPRRRGIVTPELVERLGHDES
jgi:hypothetical protein